MVNAGHRNPVFLHRLQKRRLGARAGAIDLIGQQQLAEHRPPDETERAASRFRFLQHLGAQNIGGHQIRRELHPAFIEAENLAEYFHKACFPQPGDADQQQMPTGENGNQGFLDHAGLAVDDAADTVPGGGNVPAQLVYGVDQRIRTV